VCPRFSVLCFPV